MTTLWLDATELLPMAMPLKPLEHGTGTNGDSLESARRGARTQRDRQSPLRARICAQGNGVGGGRLSAIRVGVAGIAAEGDRAGRSGIAVVTNRYAFGADRVRIVAEADGAGGRRIGLAAERSRAGLGTGRARPHGHALGTAGGGLDAHGRRVEAARRGLHAERSREIPGGGAKHNPAPW